MHEIVTRLRNKQEDEGFTLIELLVVVVIIGVLVAIAVPVYLNYRQGAADKSAQSDLRGAISAIEQYYTDNGNSYPTAPTTQPVTSSFTLGSASSAKVNLSDKTSMIYNPTTPASGTTTISSYKICSWNTGGSGKVYFYDSTAGGSVIAKTTLTTSGMTAQASCA